MMSLKTKDNIENVIMKPGNHVSKSYKIGNVLFDFRKSYVMGILNVTPDSFSDGGRFFTKDLAVDYGLRMLYNGADIIDIGGESTRPGAAAVSSEEEIKRVIPVIEGILSQQPNAIISIDTTKNLIANEALSCGAKIVNDISGLMFDSELAETVQKHDAGLVIMHMKGTPDTMQINPYYDNVVQEVYDFLSNQIHKAEDKGIHKIFIDPGIGFGKRVQDNFQLINNLDYLTELSYPVVIGISRKSFIGKTLNLEFNERDEASSVLNAVAISKGARIIRTHNVTSGVQTCKLLNEMLAAGV